MMANRTIWTGTASDLLLLCSEGAREANSSGSNWAKNPGPLPADYGGRKRFCALSGSKSRSRVRVAPEAG
jgi:hypothetical protein